MKSKSQPLRYRFVERALIAAFALGAGTAWLAATPAAHAQQHSPSSARQHQVEGIVLTTENDTVIGAVVKALPEGVAVQTDEHGRFTLKGISSHSRLTVSYLGMKTRTLAVAGRSQIEIRMEENNVIGEAVVTGYQVVNRPRMTGSVAVIKGSDIAKLDVRSIDQVLRGSLSGVVATYTGQPGEDVKIRVRGANSITGNTDPIWIIDGMPLNGIAPRLRGGDDVQRLLSQSGIGDIPPSDIESITVLKDAAATAIYGARAANGVIVVKTKSGQEGKPRYSVSLNFGLTERPVSEVPMMNSAEKLQFEREMYYDGSASRYGRLSRLFELRDRGVITSAEAEAEIARLSHINTDWFKALYRTATTQQGTVTMSGGSKRTQYFQSLNALNENGTQYNNRYNRFAYHAKLTHEFNDRLRLQTSLNAAYRANRNTASVVGVMDYAYYANPYETPDTYDQSYDMRMSRLRDGLRWPTFNMLREINDNTSSSRYIGFTLNAKLDWQTPLPGLTYTLHTAYSASSTSSRTEERAGSYTNFRNNWLNALSAYQELPLDLVRGALREGQSTGDGFTLRNLLQYNKELAGGHALQLLAGQEINTITSYGSYNYSPIFDEVHRIVGFPQLPKGTESKEIPFGQLGGTSKGVSKLSSFFFNGTYSYQDRYVLSGSARYDGSDIIGNANQFTPLWNVSARWNLYNESWLKNSEIVTFLSLRAGFGYTGSIDKNALPFVTLNIRDVEYYDNEVVPSSYRNANPNIKWQTKQDFNVGFESAFFQNRLGLNVNYYNNTVRDLLDDRSRPYSSGVASIKENVANLVNRGWEFDTYVTPIRTTDWEWTLRGNFTLNHNEITQTYYKSLSEVPRRSMQKENISSVYVQGYPVGAVFGYRFAGVSPNNGHVLIYDKQGKTFDLDLTGNATLAKQAPEVEYLGESNPPLSGGFSSSLRWRAWELSANFEYLAGHIIPTVRETYRSGSGDEGNRHITDRDRWRMAGDITVIPPRRSDAIKAYDNYLLTDGFESGDYLRCSYLTLSYTLRPNLCRSLGLSQARLSLTGSNLFTITNYRGADPALMGSFGYPTTRRYSLTLNVSF